MSMELTKRLWEQPTDKGVLAYHIIQSFSPGEATPNQVHEIGCEFARRFLADRFECTVSTHLDKGHLHNHIVVNSVSYADGKMFRNNFDTYYHGIRQVSDELCRENRLSVIETDGKGKSYDEWLSGQAGKPTIRGMVRKDVEQAIAAADSFDLRFTKARFYIVDPENEYAPLVQELGGEVVNISVDSSTYFNPLDFKPDKSTDIPPYVAKAEFVLSLCEQIMKKENVLPGDRSLIDRALRSIYKPLIESKYTAPCPTIKDLWAALNSQGDNRSKELALALEIFATGSMQVFAQPTNVDMSNRLICFNIQSLGEQLKPVAMLSMLEYINTAVMSNERNDPKAATWVYFDEIYLLLRDSLSANFLYTSWKRFRKYNAYATGITQNVQDCLTNDTAYAMLANSEFVVMLRQTKDIDSVVELYGLSEPQRKYLLLAQPGEGIIKMGNSLIPFNNPQPKDTKTYKLLTTKPGEME